MLLPVIELLESRTLMSSGAGLTVSATELLFNDPKGGKASPAQVVTLSNTGETAVTISAGGILLTGAAAVRFHLVNAPTTPVVLQPGTSLDVSVDFDPVAAGPLGAVLEIQSDDANSPVLDVTLRGLGTNGLFGGNEPSLQWILDTYQIPVHVGDSRPSESTLDLPPKLPNDEVPLQLMEKAGTGPVTVEPIAVFSNAASPALRFGYYTYTAAATSDVSLQEEFTVPSTDVQTINPHVVGNSSFDPGSGIIGLYTSWPAFGDRVVYTEDFRDTWNPALQHNVRFYPMKNVDGSLVPNAYVMAVEEAFNHDFQDGVFIVQNVMPVPPYEAENATVFGAIVAAANPGFTGTGYVDFQHASNDWLEWAVDAAAGKHTLTFGYANGGTADRPLELRVNGAVVAAKVSFPVTKSWSIWKTVSVSVTLLSGLNQIRLTSVGFNGGNFDSLGVV